jgi:hypothetical protein
MWQVTNAKCRACYEPMVRAVSYWLAICSTGYLRPGYGIGLSGQVYRVTEEVNGMWQWAPVITHQLSALRQWGYGTVGHRTLCSPDCRDWSLRYSDE